MSVQSVENQRIQSMIEQQLQPIRKDLELLKQKVKGLEYMLEHIGETI